MKEDELKLHFPKAGDRMAVVNFCNKKLNRNKWNSKKVGFIDKLMKKCKKKDNKRKLSGSSDDEDFPVKSTPEKKKSTRQIQIGWLCSEDGNRHVQVRTKHGGGTRTVTVPKSANKEYILKKGRELFFINGKSSKGDAKDFNFDVWDYSQKRFTENITVEEAFQKTGFTRLHFYIATTKKTSTVTSSDLPSTVSEDVTLDNNCYELAETSYVNLVDEAVADDDFTDELIHGIYSFDVVPPVSMQNQDYNLENGSLNIQVHRGQVFHELIEIFSNMPVECGSLQIEMILPNGQKESAYDMGGVLRDTLSEFWTSFYEQCTVGTDAKVPFVRHDFDCYKWKAVARILYRGWKDEKYLPIKLASPFIEYCIYGKVISDIRVSFLSFISKNEKDTLQMALTNFNAVDTDELYDVMDNLECKTSVNASNIGTILDDIGHKELVQKPMFVIDCWADILKNLIPIDKLQAIYKECEVTPKNVLKMLNSTETHAQAHTKVFGYLKKYIRECTERQLTNFLRFCTGSDVLTGTPITVLFNECDGFTRAPTARTCNYTLELSGTYQTFPEFRTEMNGVLESSVWVMDIV